MIFALDPPPAINRLHPEEVRPQRRFQPSPREPEENPERRVLSYSNS